MSREELIDKICPECNRYNCNDRCCEDCDEQLNKWLDEYDKKLLDKVMQKQRTIIDEDGVMYRAVLLKDIEDLKEEVSK